MTHPVFGYDTRLPRTSGLYPLLSLMTLQEGLALGLVVHASAGVGKFKKLRGGTSAIEYNAVFDGHLSPSRRVPWNIMKEITAFAAPIFQKNDL